MNSTIPCSPPDVFLTTAALPLPRRNIAAEGFDVCQLVTSEKELGSALRRGVVRLERSLLQDRELWVPTDTPKRPSVSSTDDVLRLEGALGQFFHAYIHGARDLIKEHCQLQSESREKIVQKLLLERIHAHLKQLLPTRDRLAPFCRGVDVSCSEEADKELLQPISVFPLEEQNVIKAVINERLVQLLAVHSKTLSLLPEDDLELDGFNSDTTEGSIPESLDRAGHSKQRLEHQGAADRSKPRWQRQGTSLSQTRKLQAPETTSVSHRKKKEKTKHDVAQRDSDALDTLKQLQNEIPRLQQEVTSWQQRAELAERQVLDNKTRFERLQAESSRIDLLIDQAIAVKTKAESHLELTKDKLEALKSKQKDVQVASSRQTVSLQRAKTQLELSKEAVAPKTTQKCFENRPNNESGTTSAKTLPHECLVTSAEHNTEAQEECEELRRRISTLNVDIGRLKTDLTALKQGATSTSQPNTNKKSASKRCSIKAKHPAMIELQSGPDAESQIPPRDLDTKALAHGTPLSSEEIRLAAQNFSKKVFDRLFEDSKLSELKRQERCKLSYNDEQSDWMQKLKSSDTQKYRFGALFCDMLDAQAKASTQSQNHSEHETNHFQLISANISGKVLDRKDKTKTTITKENEPSQSLELARNLIILQEPFNIEPALHQLFSTGQLPMGVAMKKLDAYNIGSILCRNFTPATKLASGESLRAVH